ncbi:MAG: amino acid-binding protein [archaeon]
MWSALKEHFKEFPAQEKVAALMLQYGLSVKKGKVYCENIEIPALRIARALGVDRRVVNASVQTIEKTAELKKVFENLHPAAYFKDVAEKMGWSVVEIVPDDASGTGILAGVSKIIADAGISIRQAVSDDPEFAEDARLLVICERQVPSSLIQKLRKSKGVKGVTIY